MSDIVIQAENLGKKYTIGHQTERGRYPTLRDVLVQNVRSFWRTTTDLLRGKPIIQGNDLEEVWALKDVSFEIRRGETVGIIGRNGAGKSTLLKVLSRITEPSAGRVTIKGRVASLLEVGTGFHPELTGRENVYLNGAILGMTRAEVKRKFDEIVAFAEIEKFLDTPVKRYSSGMYVRLAFAVAAHLEPEILMVDEVLAVGDAAFQKKCLGKMGEVAKEGRTVIFVSHQLAAIENLCDRAILLESGRIEIDGSASKVIKLYLQNVLEPSITQISLANRTGRSGNGRIRLADFRIEDTEGYPIASIQSGADIYFIFDFETSELPLQRVDIGFSIHSTRNNQILAVLYSSYQGQMFDIDSRRGSIRCLVSHFPLSPGRYRIGGRVITNGIEADWPYDGIGYITVAEGDFYGTGRRGFDSDAPFLILGEWRLDV